MKCNALNMSLFLGSISGLKRSSRCYCYFLFWEKLAAAWKAAADKQYWIENSLGNSDAVVIIINQCSSILLKVL